MGIYRQRFRVVEGVVASDEPALDGGFDLVVGALEEPWEVEAALAYLAFVPKLVCIDWSDVAEMGGHGARPGLARVVDGVFGVERALMDARAGLTARGYGAAFILVQMADARDIKSYTLTGLDGLQEAVFASEPDCDLIFTVGHDYWRSRTVLVGLGLWPS